MKCYDFELNITAYIDGDLKQSIRKLFVEHKDNCNSCNNKLINVSMMIKKLSDLPLIYTSNKFNEKLNKKIYDIDNLESSFWEKIKSMRLFGLEPIPAFGFVMSLTLIIGSSFLFFNLPGNPNVLDNKILSTKSKINSKEKYYQIVEKPKQDIPSVVDSDSSVKQNNRNFDNNIQLIKGK